MLVSPMAERNKESILEVLADYVDDTGAAFGLELGSGTGQHVVHFAQALPTVIWQPSEISPASQQRYTGAFVVPGCVSGCAQVWNVPSLVPSCQKPGGWLGNAVPRSWEGNSGPPLVLCWTGSEMSSWSQKWCYC